MPTITSHLWYDTQALEAAKFYCSTFPDSRIVGVTTVPDTPWGDTEVVSFQVVPASLAEMLRTGTKQQIARVSAGFLAMGKLDVAVLQRAYDGAEVRPGGGPEPR